MLLALSFASSRGEARRLIEQGGVRLNDAPVIAITAILAPQDFDAEGLARLSAGKKRHGIIRLV